MEISEKQFYGLYLSSLTKDWSILMSIWNNGIRK